MVWYGLVEILKLNSRPLSNCLLTKVGIELLGQLKILISILTSIWPVLKISMLIRTFLKIYLSILI